MNLLFPFKIEEGRRIINEYGEIERIYIIEDDIVGKYVSTIATDDRMFSIFRTYSVIERGKETNVEKVFEKKSSLLKNLEKATLNSIEEEIGLNALASQLN
ncbi:MAG: hypothetical protein AABX44_00285 [Nanoarchaeota archaeon]